MLESRVGWVMRESSRSRNWSEFWRITPTTCQHLLISRIQITLCPTLLSQMMHLHWLITVWNHLSGEIWRKNNESTITGVQCILICSYSIYVILFFLEYFRLSRGRRVVENAFGMLANKFRVFHRPIAITTDTIDVVVMACCALHNFLRTHIPLDADPDCENSTDHEVTPGGWRQNGPPLISAANIITNDINENHLNAQTMRQQLCNYFNSPEGSVSWQHRMI